MQLIGITFLLISFVKFGGTELLRSIPINFILNNILILPLVSTKSINNTGVHLIDEAFEERAFPAFVHPGTYNGGSELIDFLCSGESNCIRLSHCRVMIQLLDTSCLQIHKLRELTCGYTDGEPMVCCPDQNAVSQNLPQIPPTTVKPPTGIETCGTPNLHNWQANNYKGIGAHPWVVRVGFKNKVTGLLEHPCCGSIIGPRVILTAAHCALRKPETLNIVSVRVGEYDTAQNPDCTQTFCALPIHDAPLSHVIVHPGYLQKNYRHNIALLILKNKLNYSVTVQPICLQQSHAPLDGSRAKLVGWGKLPGDTETRKRQQQLELPVVSLDRCIRTYGNIVNINSNELCVGGEEGKDGCSGFGGGPLVLLQQHPRPVYTQIGIVSFGSEKCGIEGVPSVYVRVDKYIEWIKLNSPHE